MSNDALWLIVTLVALLAASLVIGIVTGRIIVKIVRWTEKRRTHKHEDDEVQ
jgi:NhaP-type Na+/H+ or K+/H+ antiporter